MTLYTTEIPALYLEPTPIYTKCLQASNVDMRDRWGLAFSWLELHGYDGPEKGWRVQ